MPKFLSPLRDLLSRARKRSTAIARLSENRFPFMHFFCNVLLYRELLELALINRVLIGNLSV